MSAIWMIRVLWVRGVCGCMYPLSSSQIDQGSYHCLIGVRVVLPPFLKEETKYHLLEDILLGFDHIIYLSSTVLPKEYSTEGELLVTHSNDPEGIIFLSVGFHEFPFYLLEYSLLFHTHEQ